jgi:hypothetical protein
MHLVRGKIAGGTGKLATIDNSQTISDSSMGLFGRPAMAAPMAFRSYARQLWAARAKSHDNDVYVVIVDSGGEANRHMTLSPGDSIIIGRHSQCDLQIPHKNVALRQLAVHVSHTSTGKLPRLRLWDLHTGKTLLGEDGQKIEALSSDGPVFLSLGRYHLAMVPLGQIPKNMPATMRDAWSSLPQRTLLSALGQGSKQTLLPERFGGPRSTTSITLLPSSIGLRELSQTPVAPDQSIATLYVESPDMSLKFQVGHEHLERGILLGRYGRCLGSGFDRSVSRVHVLLATIAGEVIAIDAASTVGCRISSLRIKSLHLNSDTTIHLSKRSLLRWTPHESSN